MELKDRVLIDLDYIKDCIDEILTSIEFDENKLSLHVKKTD